MSRPGFRAGRRLWSSHPVVALVVALGLILSAHGAALAQPIETAAEQAIIMDAESGAILFEKNAEERIPPASLTLLMTAETVFDMIKRGQLSREQEFKISEHAWRTGGAPAGGTTMFAELGSTVPVIDLLRGVIIQIANDGAIALAEGIAGSEAAFGEQMTLRGLEVGMTDSNFVNPTGYEDPKNYSTVKDLAVLARHVIRTYPELYKLFAEPEFTWNDITQRNKNPMLTMSSFQVDGLVIGGTSINRLGMVTSAKRGDLRLILAFYGLPSKAARLKEAKALLDWAFGSFEAVRLFEAGETVGEARVFGGEKSYVPLVGEGAVIAFLEENVVKGYHGRIAYEGPVVAPVEKGQPIGNLEIVRDKAVVQKIPLFAGESVGIGGFHGKAFDALIEAVAGLWY
ncbi:hypothetical protein CH339_05695 [Rhodobium orientis]|uniref:serine-type D-Ala-D-Ala carboxypeptidase n=1 Tax=Rhodobium orientis TaxID=34017 RepID=A0A327JZT0_9HYPH|nr:hypothetical protein [Rhodobium orientis]RAI28618.1 hypothetical protein CH339_05695 [Rhodobium orientis]